MESRTEFREASDADAASIAALVNSAYRGDSSRVGWTTEADFLGGQRTDLDEVSGLIGKKDSLFILCEREGGLIASVHLQREGDAAQLGMLAVKPELQGKGVARLLLHEAEKIAAELWGAAKMRMAVITFRHELMEYYERRGYRRTGRFEPFPADPKFGIPKVPDLRFEWLEKPTDPSADHRC